MTVNLITALLLDATGFLLVFRQIVLSPNNPSFPCAPGFVRAAMFVTSGALLWLGMQFFDYRGGPYAGAAAWPIAVLTGVLTLYNAVMLANVFDQHRRPGVWARIARMTAIAKRLSCRKPRAA
jgi:hypothetical protein